MTEAHATEPRNGAEHEELSFPIGTEPQLRAAPGEASAAPLVLVLGGTGYVGGRLIPRLVAAGYRVRVLARSLERMEAMPWASQVEIFSGDASDAEAVRQACGGVDILYYLIHSMTAGKRFAETDRQVAHAVARAAEQADVRRIIYLGGLHPADTELSAHLASRVEIGNILLGSSVPAIVLQAGVIIGSGSASFEMVRHLTEVLPYMPAPRWVRNFIQPIAIRDVLYYLLGAARIDDAVNRAFDIGGPDVLRYGQIMNAYAVEAGLQQRRIAALPVLTPKLASYWVGLVTPVPRSLAMPLVESLQNDCVVTEHDIDRWIAPPESGLTSYREAVRLALGRIALDSVETSWVDSRVLRAPSDPLPSDPDWAGRTVFTDERHADTNAPPSAVWAIISQIGGDRGWYSAKTLWSLRGFLDRIVGGVGLKRGRRSRSGVRAGDAIDMWRVEIAEPNTLLRLRAEMQLPGEAWLELGVEPEGHGSRYWQRATFFPQGLSGRLYWLCMLPFHGFIFRSMAQRIASQAQLLVTDGDTDADATQHKSG